MSTQANTKPRVLKGTVVSNKMKDTIVVSVERYFKHPKYGKYMRRNKRYKVRDAGNTCGIGDGVTIVETRPLSKDVTYRLLEKVSTAPITE